MRFLHSCSEATALKNDLHSLAPADCSLKRSIFALFVIALFEIICMIQKYCDAVKRKANKIQNTIKAASDSSCQNRFIIV